MFFLQSLSRRRRYVAAAAVNGKVYVIGGYDGQARLNAVECLDLSAEDPSWHSVAPMTQRRGLAGVTVYKGEWNNLGLMIKVASFTPSVGNHFFAYHRVLKHPLTNMFWSSFCFP